MENKTKELYLYILKSALSFSLWKEPPVPLKSFANRKNHIRRLLITIVSKVSERFGYQIGRTPVYSEEDRENGLIWPGYADTMIGSKRLDNLRSCIESVVADKVEGDLIETGVWRGGACIYMKGVLVANEDSTRKVYVADSFSGLPPPDAKAYPADAGDRHHEVEFLAVSKQQVMDNFRRYGLLDERVIFLEGWFNETLPKAPIAKLSVLRLDGDMYGSTIEALNALYPRLSPGGYCIIDDYGLQGCKKAVSDYRKAHRVEEEIIAIDQSSVYWRKRR